MGAVPSDPKGKTALSLESFVFIWNLQTLKVTKGPSGVGAGERRRGIPCKGQRKKEADSLDLWSHLELSSAHIFSSTWLCFVHNSGPAPGLLGFASVSACPAVGCSQPSLRLET